MLYPCDHHHRIIRDDEAPFSSATASAKPTVKPRVTSAPVAQPHLPPRTPYGCVWADPNHNVKV